jgi:hypothetical protein
MNDTNRTSTFQIQLQQQQQLQCHQYQAQQQLQTQLIRQFQSQRTSLHQLNVQCETNTLTPHQREDQLTNEVNECKKEINKLKRQLKRKEIQYQSNKDTNKELQLQLKKIRAEKCDECRTKQRTIERLYRNNYQQTTRNKNKLDVCTDQYNNLEKQHDEIKTELDNIKNTTSQTILNLQLQLQSTYNEYQAQQISNALLQETIDHYQNSFERDITNEQYINDAKKHIYDSKYRKSLYRAKKKQANSFTPKLRKPRRPLHECGSNYQQKRAKKVCK